MGFLCPQDGCNKEFSSTDLLKEHNLDEHDERVGKISVECHYCGSEFVEYLSELSRNNRTFCDNTCFGNWQSEYQTGEENPQWEGGNLKYHTCDFCGSGYSNYVKEENTSCCSVECYGELLKDRVGEKCPAWKGGYKRYYGKNWQRQRRKAIDMADEKCERCGLSREEHEEEYGTDIHVHHINRFYSFDDYREANKLDNLMTVCLDCHHEVEKRNR